MRVKTLDLSVCALFVALSAVLSQITIPIGIVPINLTHISVFLAAGLLGSRYGTFSQIGYVFLGMVGLPVFTGFNGGLGVIFSPTGGFIFGYLACTFITAYIIERFGSSFKVLIPAMYAGWLVTYALGVPWFMAVTGTNSVTAAISACMLPFLPGDLAKTVLSAILINRLRPVFLKGMGRTAN